MPSVVPSPVPSQASKPIQSANPSKVVASQNKNINTNNLLRVEDPKSSALRKSKPLKAISGKKWMREGNNVELHLQKKAKKINRHKMLEDVSNLNGTLPSTPCVEKESLPHGALQWTTNGLAIPKDIDATKDFDSKFWAWWTSLQPESHL
ncbi:hypothetical protein ARMGADRAFT_1036321 [Armillaria gallica]|uniref:Uncharacterized protein n=1 Tax=Armillaria gallica TaxID=47427 RepID=A0A2H3D463_ARMGA|nr:hypothetical protein ARMGADRAFT_1036321 [Armillaria gallica]